MISKRIHSQPQNDKYRRLANYIRDAAPAKRDHGRTAKYIADSANQGEKALYTWHAGCAADSYELAIKEIEATQALNTRSRKEKTYHLLVSFRPEDEARLTEDDFKEIEQAFAKALGFEEHQRHAGVHKNTANLHMHVAYNMIHPVSLTRREPFRDYRARDRACRELEKRFDLAVDNGREQGAEPKRQNEKARTVEAHTRQQSFDGYCQEKRHEVLAGVEQATSWGEAHRAFAEYGLEIVPRGNGCVVRDRHGKHAVKASSLDRGLSKAALEKRFGPFEPSRLPTWLTEKSRYDGKPLQRGPERAGLWQEYKAGIEERKAEGKAIKEARDAAIMAVGKKWEKERGEVIKAGLPPRETLARLRETRSEERQELAEIRRESAARKAELQERVPFWSWAGYLQMKAEQGSEVALAILRSNGQEAAPEERRQETLPRDEARQEEREPRLPPLSPELAEAMRPLFEQAMAARRDLLMQTFKEQDEQSNRVRRKWAAEREAAEKLAKGDKSTLVSAIGREERRELREAKEPFDARRAQISEEFPFFTWAEFVAYQRGDRDGVRLNRLREALKEQESENAKRVAFRAKWQKRRDEIRSAPGLIQKDRAQLMSVSRFEQLAQEEREFPHLRRGRVFTGYRYEVDARGVVLVKLASGGMVRDDGRELSFSPHDPAAKEAARYVARMKFGRFASQDGAKFMVSVLSKDLLERQAKSGKVLEGEIIALKQELPTAFPSREKALLGMIKALREARGLPEQERAAVLKKHAEWLREEMASCPMQEKEMWATRVKNLTGLARRFESVLDR